MDIYPIFPNTGLTYLGVGLDADLIRLVGVLGQEREIPEMWQGAVGRHLDSVDPSKAVIYRGSPVDLSFEESVVQASFGNQALTSGLQLQVQGS